MVALPENRALEEDSLDDLFEGTMDTSTRANKAPAARKTGLEAFLDDMNNAVDSDEDY